LCYSVGTVDLPSVLWEINVCGIDKCTEHVDVQLFFLICVALLVLHVLQILTQYPTRHMQEEHCNKTVDVRTT
jgi:hypothetical protein